MLHLSPWKEEGPQRRAGALQGLDQHSERDQGQHEGCAGGPDTISVDRDLARQPNSALDQARQLALAEYFWQLGDVARYAPLMRSVRHLWTEPVRPRRALEKAEFDQYPDRADDRDKGDKHPPTGFVAVVKAFDIDDNGRDQRDSAKMPLKSPMPSSGL
jgi:hypothetical protein